MTLNSPIMTVGVLTANIKRSLQSVFSSVTVKGEMSNVTLHSRGHLYFDLKDAEAKIACVCFHFKTKSLTLPKEGDAVVIYGDLTVYAPQGKYQIAVTRITFSGVGELLLKFEEMKKKFSELGYFESSRKKKIPQNPRSIGIITSPTGAVIQDIINVLTRRNRTFRLILNPVKVQGLGSEDEIVSALEEFNRFNLVDVIILARGGGSIEDLWTFNTPSVVEALFKSQIPVISAIGHETDVTLADFVADVRAPTPSAAAEIVTYESAQEEIRLQTLLRQAAAKASHRLKYASHKISSLKKQLDLSDFQYEAAQRLDYIREDLQKAFSNRISSDALRLSIMGRSLTNLLSCNHFKNKQEHLYKHLQSAFSNRLNIFKQKFENYRLILEHLHFLIKNSTLDKNELISKGNRFHAEIVAQLNLSKDILKLRNKELNQSVNLNIEYHKQRLARYCDQLRALHPDNAFKRGFAMLLDFNTRSAIFSKQELIPSTPIIAVFQDGEAVLSVGERVETQSGLNHETKRNS